MRPIRQLLVGPEVRGVLVCPEEGRTRTLEECIACEQFECVQIDAAERSLFVKCAGREVPPEPTPLGDLMSRVTICVGLDTPIEEIRRIFLEDGISGVPVVDGRARPLGMVSKTDLLDRRRGGRARDVMMPLLFALAETAPVGRAAALMATEGIHRVAVVAPDGALLGLVSSLDVMRWVAEREGWLEP